MISFLKLAPRLGDLRTAEAEAVAGKNLLDWAVLETLMCVSFFVVSVSSAKNGSIEQWKIFETAFESTKHYENPVQDVRLKVEFTPVLSCLPLRLSTQVEAAGESKNGGGKRTILAFWDSERTWRVRFSPDELGNWTYRTSCSEKDDKGLHNQTGSFQCKKYEGDLPLFKHGELRLAENRRYIEHADGTVFFWLADTVWCGPLLSDFKDWKVFLKDRVEKDFTAIQFVLTQWRMTPTDADGNPTFTGKERISVNPAFFQRMDKYVDAINDAGLVAVPVLLWAIRGDTNPGYYLPEDQKIVLAEYMIARYGAHQVVWFLGGDGNYSEENAETWKRVGRAVFNNDQHRLATMHARGKSWVGKEFRNEPWYSFIGYQSGHGDDEKTFRWLNQGPPSTEWNDKPNLPVINIEPNYEAHNGYTYRKVHTDHSVRRAAYWSLLVSPTAGVTYGGQGIWGWHTKVQAPADHVRSGLGSPWYIAKDLPGAFSMKYLHQLFKSIEWWRLVPAPEILVEQPGKEDASKFIAAAKSHEGDLVVVYLPEGGSVTVKTDRLQRDSIARWYHPRTGGWLDAGKVEKTPQTFETSDLNDWVLLLKNENAS